MIKNYNKTDLVTINFFVLTFFTNNLLNLNFLKINIDIFLWSFFLMYFIFFIKWDKKITKKFIYLFLSILLFQIFIKIINELSLFGLIKQIIPIIIIYTSTYFILTKYKFNKIFDAYEKLIILICVIGLIQIFLNIFDIQYFQKELWRMNSIIKEPSHLGMLILPILIKNIIEYKKLNIKLLILVISISFTFSLTVIIAFIFSIFIFGLWKFINIKQSFSFKLLIPFLMPLILFGLFAVYAALNHTSGTLGLFLKTDTQHFTINHNVINQLSGFYDILFNLVFNPEIYHVNQLSLHSIISTLKITIFSLIQNPFGTGLGGNEEIFHRFNEIFINFNFKPYDEVNIYKRYYFSDKTGHSLFLRMILEFGLIFIFLVIAILCKLLQKLKTCSMEEIIIIIPVLSFLICKTIKLGSYIDYGTNFFIIALIITLFRKNELN